MSGFPEGLKSLFPLPRPSLTLTIPDLVLFRDDFLQISIITVRDTMQAMKQSTQILCDGKTPGQACPSRPGTGSDMDCVPTHMKGPLISADVRLAAVPQFAGL